MLNFLRQFTSLKKKKRTKRFPFPTPVPVCAPEGGTEEVPGRAKETKAAGAARSVRPGKGGDLGAGTCPRTAQLASSLLGFVPSFRHCCGELRTLVPWQYQRCACLPACCDSRDSKVRDFLCVLSLGLSFLPLF